MQQDDDVEASEGGSDFDEEAVRKMKSKKSKVPRGSKASDEQLVSRLPRAALEEIALKSLQVLAAPLDVTARPHDQELSRSEPRRRPPAGRRRDPKGAGGDG